MNKRKLDRQIWLWAVIVLSLLVIMWINGCGAYKGVVAPEVETVELENRVEIVQEWGAEGFRGYHYEFVTPTGNKVGVYEWYPNGELILKLYPGVE